MRPLSESYTLWEEKRQKTKREVATWGFHRWSRQRRVWDMLGPCAAAAHTHRRCPPFNSLQSLLRAEKMTWHVEGSFRKRIWPSDKNYKIKNTKLWSLRVQSGSGRLIQKTQKSTSGRIDLTWRVSSCNSIDAGTGKFNAGQGKCVLLPSSATLWFAWYNEC